MEYASGTQSQKEIMEKIPDSLSRIGILLLLLVMLALFILSYCIRYPDTLNGKATLNSLNPAINLVMPSSGKIILLVPPQNFIKEKEIIAIVDNPANYKDVIYLKKILLGFHKLDSIKNYDLLYSKLSINVELGEVKISYIKFLIALKTFLRQNNISIYNHEIKSFEDRLKMEIASLKEKKTILEVQNSRLHYSKESLDRDSLLFLKEVISQSDYESSKSLYLNQIMQYREFCLSLKNQEESIVLIKNEIEKINLQKNKENDVAYNMLIDSYMELCAIIESWEKKYLITTPIEGLLEHTSFLSSNQYVNANTILFSIMPNERVSEVEVILPSEGVGKVKKGHLAIIKLADFPSKEYGDLTGRVTEISLSRITVEGQNLTPLKVKLDNDGLTNYGRLIKLHYGMPATVDIITDNKRLITRIFERFRYSTKNN